MPPIIIFEEIEKVIAPALLDVIPYPYHESIAAFAYPVDHPGETIADIG